MKPIALLICLGLAACGGGAENEDPAVEDAAACSIPVGQVKVTAGAVDEVPVLLECTDEKLACEGATELKKVACPDGFAFQLERGSGVLMLRLKGGSEWTAGARLNGEIFTGSLSMSGLFAPADPIPPTGQKQRASFFLASDTENATGTFSVEW